MIDIDRPGRKPTASDLSELKKMGFWPDVPESIGRVIIHHITEFSIYLIQLEIEIRYKHCGCRFDRAIWPEDLREKPWLNEGDIWLP